jgi:hypothetical protein
MRLTLSTNKSYSSILSKEEIIHELNNLDREKKFGGLKVDQFDTNIMDSNFSIQRYSNGLDGFTLEKFPLINGEIISEKPTVINIKLKPNLFTIVFFAIFVFTFIPVGIFIDEMTINGVKKVPTILERLTFAGLGGLIPGLWCYFGYIRPIKKAEIWIVNRLNLTPVENSGNR